MTTINRNDFIKDHGEILNLLAEKVDFGDITTLVQYYDLHLCYFTFSDFQLAPALEGFQRILGRALRDHDPFPKLDEDITLEKITLALSIDVQYMLANWDTHGNFKGFTKKFLEGQP